MKFGGASKKAHALYRQFGAKYLFISPLRKLFKYVLSIDAYYILACRPESLSSSEGCLRIVTVDASNISEFIASNHVGPDLSRQLAKFVEFEDCYCLVAYSGECIAGWGFVQRSGRYSYSRYTYDLPRGTYMLKNLYVMPDFRGRSIGKELNIARIKSVPDRYLAMVFVIDVNKYAIRNLEMFGFFKVIRFREYFFFSRFHFRRISVISNCPESNTIIHGWRPTDAPHMC